MKSLFHITLILLAPLLFGCVSEEDVFDEEFVEINEATTTPLITAYLNETYIKTQNSNFGDPFTCFTLKFPIHIEYSTGQTIKVENESGLIQISLGQTSNFHITGMVFPITIFAQDQETTLDSITEFQLVINECQLTTLKNTLTQKIDDCFSFQYPISTFNATKNTVSLSNSTAFKEFIESQNSTYVLTFLFPFVINDDVINNYFDIYEITNKCIEEDCDEIIVLQNETDIENQYSFTLQSNFQTTINTISWFINDELIDGETAANLDYQFIKDGTYEVCGKAFNNCGEQKISCTSLEITINDCSDISFQYEPNEDLNYIFTVPNNIAEKYEIFSWSVDGSFIEANDGQFQYQFFEPVTYEVCLLIETPECPQGYEFCLDVEAGSFEDPNAVN